MITSNPFVTSCRRKVKAVQSLSKMSQKTAAVTHRRHSTKSEWFNISDTVMKLCSGNSNGSIAVVNRCSDNDQIAKRDSKLKSFSVRKAKAEEE